MKIVFPTTTKHTASIGTITSLLAASSATGTIITNTDLGLSGFKVGDGGLSSMAWNIDNSGAAELLVETFTCTCGSKFIDLYNFQNDFKVLVNDTNSASYVVGLPKSVTVSNSLLAFTGSSFAGILISGSLGYVSNIFDGMPAYIGFKFNPLGTELFGWARIRLTESPGNFGTFEVLEWAYDDSGDPIHVPEPATTALGLAGLAMGAAGLRRWRKRRA